MLLWKQWIHRADKRGSAFLTLLVSFILIFLLPVMIGAILFNAVEGSMMDNAYRSNKAMLEQVRLGVDSRVKEVEQLSAQIGLNPKLQWLLDRGGEGEAVGLYPFVEFMKELSRYQTVSSSIHNFYIYFANTDTILTPSMMTRSDMYFRKISAPRGQSYSSFKTEVLESYHPRSFLPSANYNDGLRLITYAQSLPLGERNDPKGTLVILVDEREVRNLLDQIEWVSSGSIYILNEHQDIIMTTSAAQHQLSAELKARLLSGREYLPYTQDNGQEMMVTLISSAQNGWTYVSVVPKEVVLNKVNQVKAHALWLVLLCMIGGAVASYYLAYRNYRPIREVMSAIVQGKGVSWDSQVNEYEFIKKSIAASMDEETRLKRMISRQEPVIQADFISRLVRGHVDASTVTREDLTFMGVSFRHDSFCIVVLDIDDGKRFMKADTEKERALLRFIIGNLGTELLGDQGRSIEVELNRILFLMNLPDGPAPASMEEVKKFVSDIRGMLEQRFNIQATLAIGGIHTGLGRIADCYSEAMMAMDYKLIKGHNSVLYYDELSSISRHYYHYPASLEMQLMNYVKSGNERQTEDLLSQLYEVNFHTRGLTPEMGRCLFFNLLSTYLKLTHALNFEPLSGTEGEPDPVKQISDCTTARQMFRITVTFFLQLCGQVKQERTGHSEQLYRNIVQYINKDFGNSNLSLTTIAGHFELNASYLSTFFKRQSSQNVSDYILKVRVEEAKRLLGDKSCTLTDIAVRVGYANSAGLIRAFKKVEGITPGQFRINLQNSTES